MKTIGKRSLALFLLLTLLAGAGRLRWTDVGGKRHACAARPAHQQPKAARLRESSRIL